MLFDESKPGATRKVIARNHQVLGVNRAVASVIRQEDIKASLPEGQRLRHRVVELPLERKTPKKRGQIYNTFVGCGIAGKETPRAASGDDLERVLRENHRYVFSLIHKFNKDVNPKEPYSERDDIIVISDEAHRTQDPHDAQTSPLGHIADAICQGPVLQQRPVCAKLGLNRPVSGIGNSSNPDTLTVADFSRIEG